MYCLLVFLKINQETSIELTENSVLYKNSFSQINVFILQIMQQFLDKPPVTQ